MARTKGAQVATASQRFSYTEAFGEAMKENLAKAGTLREVASLWGIPFDLVLRWIDPSSDDYVQAAADALRIGQELGRHPMRAIQDRLKAISSCSDYTPALLPLIESIVECEMSQKHTLNSVAAKIGISRQTLDKWMRLYPEVNDAVERGRTLAIAFLEEQALKYLVEDPFGPKLNTNLFKHMAAVHDPEHHKMNDSSMTVKGDKENPIQFEGITINLVSPGQLKLKEELPVIDVESEDTE